jgi:hypothetical protein
MQVITIKPEWRTSTVIALCQHMRDAQDFAAMPILADALQDADCDNENLLQVLRFGSGNYAEDAAIVAMIKSPDAATSVRWLLAFADAHDGSGYEDHYSRKWTYQDFMEAAANYLRTGDYITGGTELEAESVPDVFWDHYQAITGQQVPESKRGSFFSCSC